MKEKILEETMDFLEDDYASAVKEMYQRKISRFSQLENTYKSWSQSTQIYALSKADGTGRPVVANIKAYNDTIVERKKIAIIMKLTQKEIKFLEEFWENKGFDINELRKITKTKELVKSHIPTKDIGHLDKDKPVEQKHEIENGTPSNEHVCEKNDNIDNINEDTVIDKDIK